jgi:hypothetical protein
MTPNPYRTPASLDAAPAPASRFVSYEIAVVGVIAWALGVMRVIFALGRSEAPSREIDLAWLLVALAPIIVWREIASQRRP